VRSTRAAWTQRWVTCENEIRMHQRLPPGEVRQALRQPTCHVVELNRGCDAPVVEVRNAVLEAVPMNADQEIPAPGGPTECEWRSHQLCL